MRQKPFLHEKSILLVDENRDFLDTVAEVLDMYVVHTAQNSCEAEELLEKYPLDIIILTSFGHGRFHLLKRALKLGLVAVVLTLRPVSLKTSERLQQLGPVFFFRTDKIMELGEFIEMLTSKRSYPFTRSLAPSELRV